MQNTPRPFRDIEFNFKASLSLEDAVLALLGWQFDFEPFREVTEAESLYAWELEQNGIPVDDKLSLYEVLRDIKHSADSTYVQAKNEDPENLELINECRNEIQKAHDLFELARQYYCDMVDELARGDQSVLRLDKFTRPTSTETYITWNSLQLWASKHNIALYTAANLTKTAIQTLGIDPDEISDRVRGHKTVNAKDLLMTLANLAIKYADTPKLKKPDGINRDAFFKEIFKSYENPKGHSGLGRQSVDTRLKQAMQVKKIAFDGQIGPTEYTNLQYLVAVLIIKYAEKFSISQDADSLWIETIANQIQAPMISGQDISSIVERLKTAYQSL